MECEIDEVIEDGYKTQCNFVCPECGMEFEAFIPDEETEPQEIGNQGFGKCMFCGGWLGWSCDFMLSDVTGEDLPDEEDSLVQDLFCPKCGARITAYYPKEG